MEIQKKISATLKKKLKQYRNQSEFAQELGIGHTTLQNLLSGRGNPNADTIELVSKGLKISPAQLVSGEITPAGKAFDLISGMVESLHPSLQATGVILLDEFYQLFQLSENRYAEGTYWQYSVTEPHPFRYALRASELREHGRMVTVAVSKPFTNDRSVAETAAELFTRNSLSPVHLEEVIADYIGSL